MPASLRATFTPRAMSALSTFHRPLSTTGPERCVGLSFHSATSTATKDSVLISSAHAMPPAASTSVASSGPITRPRLNCAELRLSALCMSLAGTSSASSAANAGPESRLMLPLRKATTATSGTLSWCVKASTVSTAASSICPTAPTARYVRRSNRSASAPPSGDSSRPGRYESAATPPVHSALPVTSVT